MPEPTDLPPSAADAVREAAAGLKAPDVRAALKGQPEGGEPDGAPEPEQGSPEPATTPEAGTPEPRPTDDEPEGSDYHPEDVAEYPDETEEGGEQPSQPTPETPSATGPDGSQWTDEDRKLWEDFKTSRRSEPEPTPEEPPKQEDLRDTVQRLIAEDPDVARRVNELEPHRVKFVELRDTTVPAAEKAVTDARKALESARERLADREELASADPDDLQAGERVQAAKARVLELSNELSQARLNLNETRADYAEASSIYNSGIEELREIGLREQGRAREQAEESRIRSEASDQALKEWNAALPNVLKKYDFTDEDLVEIDEYLDDAVGALQEAPEDLESWIDWKVGRVARLIKRRQNRSVAAYGDGKRRAADQGVPPDRAKAPEREPERLSSRAENARALRALKRELSAAR